MDASASEFAREAERLHVEMLEAAIRGTRFERQNAVDVTGRRQELERTRTAAAEAGDTKAVMGAERDLSLSRRSKPASRSRPTRPKRRRPNSTRRPLSSRLAPAKPALRRLRSGAGPTSTPLAPGAPPLPESEQKAQERARLDPGARLAAREAALGAVRAMSGPFELEAAAAVFAREFEAQRTARAQALHAEDVAQLEQVARLVAQVRDTADLEAERRLHAPMDVRSR